jgi:putative ABC transport system permease protein
VVAKMSPAEAMRGDIPAGGGQRSLLERIAPPLQRVPIRWLMVVRGIGRNKRRSVSTVVGVVLALVLILTSWGMIDTVQVLLDRQFNEVDIGDVSIVFQEPVTAGVVSEVASRSGVSVAEPVVTLSVAADGADGAYATELRGYEPNSQVHGFLTESGKLPPSGILAGSALADQIGARVGDSVTLTFPQLSTSIDTTIAGFVTEPVGTVLYMDVNILRTSLAATSPPVDAAILTQPSITSVAAVFDPGADRDAIIAALKSEPSVAAVVDNQAFYDLVAGFMGFFYMFVGVMLAFGAAMAFSLIFNTISVNVAERSGEYASMRANGLSLQRIGALIVGENLFLTILGIVPGLVVGYFFAFAYMGSFSSDLFSFNLEMRGSTLVFSALAMVAVAALSLIPGIRSVRNLDVATVVRERSL